MNSPQYSASTQQKLLKIKTETVEAAEDKTEQSDGQRDNEANMRAGQDIVKNDLNE